MSHDHAHTTKERSVAIAALLTGAFMLAEIVGGVLSGSLALLADAGHMLTDFAGLALAWMGFRLARRPADWKRTYGFDRFSILVAFVNGLALFVIAVWIGIEAWQRLNEPVEVMGGLMLEIALAGLLVNVAAFLVLQRGDKENLNIRAAVLHVAGDLLGSMAAIVASLVILLTGWMAIDPILSLLVAVIILRAAWRVVGESGHILLEGVPEDVDVRAVSLDLIETIEGVEDVHHVHAWSITQERPMITFHARILPGSDSTTIRSALRRRLQTQFGIAHATIELEQEEAEDDKPVIRHSS